MTHAVPALAPVPAATDVQIREVLAGRLVQPLFQPIVDLGSRAVVGVEALARGPAGSALQFPDRLFAAARDAGVVGELDLLCCERALECAIAAPVTPPLVFVNAEPGVLNQPLSPRLIELIRNGLPFRQILEYTERALPAVPGSLLRIAGQIQQWGNGLALDDVGVDPMSLAFLPILEPEVIKLDMSLVRQPARGHHQSSVRGRPFRSGANRGHGHRRRDRDRTGSGHRPGAGCALGPGLVVRPAGTDRQHLVCLRPDRRPYLAPAAARFPPAGGYPVSDCRRSRNRCRSDHGHRRRRCGAPS